MSKFGLAKALEIVNNVHGIYSDTESESDEDQDTTQTIPVYCQATYQHDLSVHMGDGPELSQIIPADKNGMEGYEDPTEYILTDNEHDFENTLSDVRPLLATTSDCSKPVTDDNNNESDSIVPIRGRKRLKNESEWAQNVRKRMRQGGKEYTNSRGMTSREKTIKTTKDCQGKCKFKCATYFTHAERESVFQSFWKLNDTEKNTFYANTTDRKLKERTRTLTEQSKRNHSIQYYLVKGIERIRVCREFYLSTLDISAKRIEYFYTRSDTGFEDRRGFHSKKRVPEEERVRIREHIKSFPRVPSHYCRATTNKEYLEANLTITKMYRMYKDMCIEKGILPQKECIYRKIVNTEFNLGFHHPKKDRCDSCEEYKIVQTHALPIQTLKFENHMKDKDNTRAERKRDRENTDREVATVCFDMENVLTCPRSNVSNFFYKRKLNVYNLTAHCNSNKIAYNVLWNECDGGRSANDIASALMVILEKIVSDCPLVNKLVLWSDSCVPQNRNSIMSLAIMVFLKRHPQIASIEQKFCTPGHSSIQEVDNVHSHIEKHLKNIDIYSPLSLLRHMKEIRKEAMDIHQMKSSDIFEYQEAAAKLYFKDIPYTRVKSLVYVGENPFHIFYKESFSAEEQTTEVSVRRQTRCTVNPQLPVPRSMKNVHEINELKRKDVESMLKFMPPTDRSYMEHLLKIGNLRPRNDECHK